MVPLGKFLHKLVFETILGHPLPQSVRDIEATRPRCNELVTVGSPLYHPYLWSVRMLLSNPAAQNSVDACGTYVS